MGFNERVVDGDDFEVLVLDRIAEDDTPDPTEAVDADLDGSHDAAPWLGGVFGVFGWGEGERGKLQELDAGSWTVRRSAMERVEVGDGEEKLLTFE